MPIYDTQGFMGKSDENVCLRLVCVYSFVSMYTWMCGNYECIVYMLCLLLCVCVCNFVSCISARVVSVNAQYMCCVCSSVCVCNCVSCVSVCVLNCECTVLCVMFASFSLSVCVESLVV